VTEIFQALDVIPGQAFGLETVEEVSAQVLVGRTFLEHMVEDHQHRMPHRDQSALPAPASRQARMYFHALRMSQSDMTTQ